MNTDRASTIVDHSHAAAPAGPETRWRSSLPAHRAAAAVAVAVEVGQRLCDTESTPVPPDHAGRAVLFGQLDRLLPDQGWAAHAHRSLTIAARSVEQHEPSRLSLFGGLGEVAFSADALSECGTRYQRLLSGLDGAITTGAAALGAAVRQTPAGLPFSAFDVISGAAGVGAYLLRRKDETALRAILTGLVALCGVSDDGLPNWHTPFAAIHPDTPMARAFPTGVFNSGLAHGITGPMAVLALAELDGISVPGQPAAIERVARWLIAHRADDDWGPSWASGIPMPDPTGSAPPAYGPTHNAWCYGSAGIARALWLAGTALADKEFSEFAGHTLTAVYRRPASARRIDTSPGLCHGIAGLLQITVRFASDTGDPGYSAAAGGLTDELIEMFEPGARFGYRAIGENDTTTDDPSLLDGAAGIALALLAAATDISPSWDRMLLLA
ncbi:lanthionine synthetase C family protein [Nocardia colli]|uniref:lanthionine synthetase C family protein n=1 Tax=Nocardia colli TaxID=2545717 RepID=UPI00168CC103|nr:lanthionine synthetase C family protein [Nocardia colli]